MSNELEVQSRELIVALYQNREQEAIKKVGELLPAYQSIIQEMILSWKDDRAIIYLKMLKDIVENYQAQDMIGIADCLQEFALPMLIYYKENKCRHTE